MPETEELIEPIDIDTTTEGFTLILYNDAVHSFEEVTEQVMRATGFGFNKAEAITMEAHSKGRAVVLTGDLDQCIKAQHVLEEIALRTSIEVNA
jgi:ATP-dependent Clp protease adapter protein ClpS